MENKLRIFFIDNSFLDVWLSEGGDYSFHWEHRAQRGLIHRWDNAPDHPELATFPEHFHNGSDKEVEENELSEDHEKAIKDVLGAQSKNVVIYHRGERRVRRVLRLFQSLLGFSGASAFSVCSAVKFKDIAISLKNSTVPFLVLFKDN